MSVSGQGIDPPRERKLEASPESITETDDGFELAVRLTNPLDRAIHYIADVRAMIFDPASRRLRIQLSDQGREMPPGAIAVQPRIQHVDPGSETVATVRLPRTIVKLSETLSTDGEIMLEEHAIADAEAIDLEIGWSDTPYYPDPREKQPETPPISSWEQAATHVTFPTGKSGGEPEDPIAPTR